MQEHVQVDSSKCKACRRCEVACIASHHGLDFKTAMKQKALYSPRCWAVKEDDYKTSVRCHGCNPAPCCAICPTGALQQNKDGSFSIHLELCAGCMMCASVCPYGCIAQEVAKPVDPSVPAIDVPRPAAVRCDLCHDWRLEKGVDYTACMEACMTRALVLIKRDGTIVEAPKLEKKPVEKEAKAVEGSAEKKTENAEPVKEAPVKVEQLVAPTVETPDEKAPEATASSENSEAKVQPEGQQAPRAEQGNGKKQKNKKRK